MPFRPASITNMTIAACIFAVAFLLTLISDRLIARVQRKRGAASVLRIQKLIASLLWATMGGAVLAMTVIQMLAGVFQGLRIPMIVRVQHPFWFWTITGGLLIASFAMVVWNLRDFVRALKSPANPANAATANRESEEPPR
jgi:hypothetical protein